MSDIDGDPALAAFQAQLLRLLADETLDPETVVARLRDDPAAEPFVDYVDALDLRCVEVAGRITRKFAVRNSG